MMTRYSLSRMNYAKDKTIFYDKYNGLPRISDVRDGKGVKFGVKQRYIKQ